ncbi:Phosphate regulon transcriptional regulatory protein PhoB (SphR) [Caballeronia glathei]|jgi:two-component system OmpR family response regulator|uniref:Transcriptional regulator n=1 Tax=Caballeronia glathei TaxID=60547 RepID=A0A069Q2B2_9BURK|nr:MULTISPECIES: response regulator [Burkholderiaceae]KDR43926.1 transcriptional regulator [Caballeronia glathei]TCK38671.1 two-component system OmpR family response regulator [Paraburkholderia sp. BL8N3]CDY74273.1 Phosphate regulon transcriptional regulatory protein PhoB (SphR) [Caballeronia glathei]
MHQILVVDDDASIRDLLREYLQGVGYRVSVATGSAQMKQVINTSRVDLVVLDLMLDGEDGLDIARELRRRDTVPIVMLSARGGLLDRILGLEMGADDYLPKPFDPRELLAKIRSVLRRARQAPAPRHGDAAAYVNFAGWRLDTCMKQMLSPEGVVVTLGGSDYRTLRTLLDHPNRPLSRDYLLDEVFGKERSPLDRSIDVCVSRLRQHLKDTARQATLIRTVRNEGYMLTADVSYEG